MCGAIFYKRTVCKTLLFVGAAMSVNAVALQAPGQQGITKPGDTPKWEAVSIKPCVSGETGARGTGPGNARISVSPPGRLTLSPGRLSSTCITVARLITQTFLSQPDGRRDPQIAMDGG